MSPPSETLGLKQIREDQNGTNVIFIHGILSNAEKCWRHENGNSWPELLANDTELDGFGIYTFTYPTGFFSGSYRLSDVVDSFKEYLRLASLLRESKRLLFVGHSMGGIVARQFVVERQVDLLELDIQVGLFLVASPSLGSKLANYLTGIAKLLGVRNSQAEALTFSQNNAWLNDLDKNFRNLKEGGKLSIIGKELIEHKPTELIGDKSKLLNILFRRQVVEPFSASRYFGEPFKVPESDHSTIAAPVDTGAIQYQLLSNFMIDNFALNCVITSDMPPQANEMTDTVKHESDTDTEIWQSKPQFTEEETSERRFRVGLSFPGEYRKDVIEPVAHLLARKFTDEKVLYDEFHQAELNGLDLDVKLSRLYLDECELIVIFLCSEYQNKKWCRLEWRAVRAMITAGREDQIMLFTLDDIDPKTIDGLYENDCYEAVSGWDSKDIADLILRKLSILQPKQAQDDRLPKQELNSSNNSGDSSKPVIAEQDKTAELQAIYTLVNDGLKSVLNNGGAITEHLRSILGLSAESNVSQKLCSLAQRDVSEIMTKTCLATRKALEDSRSNPQKDKVGILSCGQELLYWLLLFAVDTEWLYRHRDVFSDNAESSAAVLSATSAFGVNAGKSAVQKTRPARMELVAPFEFKIPEATEINEMLETGPGLASRLDEIKTALWTTVFPIPEKTKPEDHSRYLPPASFGRGKDNRNNNRLNKLILEKRKAGGQDHYCITSLDINKTEFAEQVVANLLTDLPDLNVVVYGGGKDKTVLAFVEDDIISKFHTMEDIISEFE